MATHDPGPDVFRRQVAPQQNQTEPDWTCLVLEHASHDRAAVAELLTDERLRLLPPEPTGVYQAFEHLLGSCEENLPVFLCDRGEYGHPDKLDRMLPQTGSADFSALRVVDGRVSGHGLGRLTSAGDCQYTRELSRTPADS